MYPPQHLKHFFSSGLLSSPLTDFDEQSNLRPATYRERLEWLASYGAGADKLIDEFFMPCLAIRNRDAGYAVSIVKAGARVVGRDAGPTWSGASDRSHCDADQADIAIVT